MAPVSEPVFFEAGRAGWLGHSPFAQSALTASISHVGSWVPSSAMVSSFMNFAAQEMATVAERHEVRRVTSLNPSCLLAFAVIILALPAAAQTIVDGDTIKLKGTTYRLMGIDAAEKDQACNDGWAAGRAAIGYLRDLVQDGEVACEPVAKRRDGATLALCTVDGDDLGAAMVAAGMAWASTRHGRNYIGEEAQANIDRLGVHGHDCVTAWNWRIHQRRR